MEFQATRKVTETYADEQGSTNIAQIGKGDKHQNLLT
jgi:hypothetical protein